MLFFHCHNVEACWNVVLGLTLVAVMMKETHCCCTLIRAEVQIKTGKSSFEDSKSTSNTRVNVWCGAYLESTAFPYMLSPCCCLTRAV